MHHGNNNGNANMAAVGGSNAPEIVASEEQSGECRGSHGSSFLLPEMIMTVATQN